MDGRICDLLEMFISRIESDIQERGIERADIREMGELADIVKDLAKAESSRMKARYYGEVVAAMEEGGRDHPYSEFIEPLRKALQSAGPDERERIRTEVRKVAGLM